MACAFSIWALLWAFTRGKAEYIFRVLFANSMVLLMLRPQQAISYSLAVRHKNPIRGEPLIDRKGWKTPAEATISGRD